MNQSIVDVVGRLLLGHMFLISGFSKITNYPGTAEYMELQGVSDVLLPLVILIEVAGSVLLILGWYTRWAALALALFTLLVSVLLHTDFTQPIQAAMFMKNAAIVGGLLVVLAHGAGQLSIDARTRYPRKV